MNLDAPHGPIVDDAGNVLFIYFFYNKRKSSVPVYILGSLVWFAGYLFLRRRLLMQLSFFILFFLTISPLRGHGLGIKFGQNWPLYIYDFEIEMKL